MASLNKVINDNHVIDLYLDKKYSLPDISKITGVCISTIRLHLIKAGVVFRPRVDAIRLHPEKLGKGKRKTLFLSEQTKRKISQSRLLYGELHSKGVSLKPSGYYEITRGPEKGRRQHDIIMEGFIGRRLKRNEVVHHINKIKTDNSIENLQLLTRAEHSSIHASESFHKRTLDGKFTK